MAIALWLIGLLLLLATSLLYVRLRVGGSGTYLMAPKTLAGSFSLLITLIALPVIIVTEMTGPWSITLLYGLLALAAGIPVLWILRTPPAVTEATFGPLPQPGPHALRRPWGLRLPRVPEPRWQRDVAIATPGRPLLCDIWQPPVGMAPSRLAFIYFHGSGWTIMDKDNGTRPFFRHLAAQGHLVMDLAYRLYPETDLAGMVADARRSVAWLKGHAAEYGIDPERIVTGGGSAGAQIALLAAFTEANPDLTPSELHGVDTTVRGVVSFYGPADLTALYRHCNIARLAAEQPDPPDWNGPVPPGMRRLMGPDAERLKLHLMAASGRLDWVLGGSPEELPDRYALFSPATHVHPGCPPLLMMQGAADSIVPAVASDRMAAALRSAGVPVASLLLPFMDHAFDLFGPEWSPAARRTLWETERFLAVMAR